MFENLKSNKKIEKFKQFLEEMPLWVQALIHTFLIVVIPLGGTFISVPLLLAQKDRWLKHLPKKYREKILKYLNKLNKEED